MLYMQRLFEKKSHKFILAGLMLRYSHTFMLPRAEYVRMPETKVPEKSNNTELNHYQKMMMAATIVGKASMAKPIFATARKVKITEMAKLIPFKFHKSSHSSSQINAARWKYCN